MKVVERMVQVVQLNQWSTYKEMEKRFTEIEERIGGFPAKRYHHPFHDQLDHIVWVREWDSLAAMEEAYEKEAADPEFQEVVGSFGVLVNQSREMYRVVTLD